MLKDFDIPIEDLVRYAIGIELFEHIDNVSQAKDRFKKECVKMYDVIRDVAISIASEQHSFMVRCDEVLEDWPENVRLKNYAVISLKLDGMHGLLGSLKFPNLKLLQLDCNARLPRISYDLNKRMEVKVQETQDSFYQGMKELKVLALSYMFSSLPTSFGCLINLRALSLFRCRLIDDDISKSCIGTTFQRCCKVEESKEGAKAIIDELVSLSNLVALDIALINITFWPRGLVVEKVKKFNIVGVTDFDYILDPCYSLSNLLELQVQNMSDIIETRLNLLLKGTEILDVNSRTKGLKILCDLVDKDGFECLMKLSLRFDLEYLINTADGVPQTSHECRLPNKAFSASKVLVMEFLSELTNLWKVPTQLVWLGNLMSVHVWHCEKLESKFSLFIARDLVQLQDLSIGRCDMMEIIVSSEGGEHEIATDKIEFPKLKQLHLRNLPSFTAICKAMNIIELPQLSYLALWEIPKLKRLCLLQIQRVIVIPSFNPSSTRS
ncbi:unnamed protein product [Camellia sinensis]